MSKEYVFSVATFGKWKQQARKRFVQFPILTIGLPWLQRFRYGRFRPKTNLTTSSKRSTCVLNGPDWRPFELMVSRPYS